MKKPKKIAFICPHKIGEYKNYKNGAYQIGNKEIHIVQGHYFEYDDWAGKQGVPLQIIYENHCNILLDMLQKFPIKEMDKIYVYIEPAWLEKALPKLQQFPEQKKAYFIYLYEEYNGWLKPKGYIEGMLKKFGQEDAEIVKCAQWAKKDIVEQILKEIMADNDEQKVLEDLLK